jgi:hypothetical protein
LIITEATAAMAGCTAFWTEPGIYSEAQVAGWQQVTEAVHASTPCPLSRAKNNFLNRIRAGIGIDPNLHDFTDNPDENASAYHKA